MAEAYLKDQKAIMPAAAWLSGEYGYDGFYFGVPTVIGRAGIEKVVEVPLSDNERDALATSAGAVKSLVAGIQL